MKLAVKNTDGVKTTMDGTDIYERLSTYYLVPTDYDFESNNATDVSDIQNLWDFYQQNKITYKLFRTMLKIEVSEKGFNTYNDFWKSIIAENFAADTSDVSTIITDEAERTSKGIIFHQNSMITRQKRLDHVVSFLYNVLSKADTQEIINDVSTGNLIFNYVEFGLEGTTEGDLEGLYDYINGTTGTAYAGVGLRNKSYTPVGTSKTVSEIADECLLILRGNE